MNLKNEILKARRTYVIGNGGSFANADHIVNDLISCGVRAYTINPATLMANANDYGFYHCFSRWLKVVGEPGDLLIALSGSGRSPNILIACEEAERIGMKVWKIFGAERGEDMQLAEENQIRIGHSLMKELKE